MDPWHRPAAAPFYIHDCHLSVGDDNIAAHSSNLLVEDCTFGTGHGASIGSLGEGTALQNLTFRNISFSGTTTGCRIKCHQGATGYVKDVFYEQLTMSGVETSIDVTMFYSEPAPPSHKNGTRLARSHEKKSKTTIELTNINFKGVTSTNSKSPGEFNCDSGGKCEVVLDTVAITASNAPGAADSYAFACQAVAGTYTATDSSLMANCPDIKKD